MQGQNTKQSENYTIEFAEAWTTFIRASIYFVYFIYVRSFSIFIHFYIYISCSIIFQVITSGMTDAHSQYLSDSLQKFKAVRCLRAHRCTSPGWTRFLEPTGKMLRDDGAKNVAWLPKEPRLTNIYIIYIYIYIFYVLYIYTYIQYIQLVLQDPLPNTKAIAVFPDGETMLTQVSYNVVAGVSAYVHPDGPVEMKDCRTVQKPRSVPAPPSTLGPAPPSKKARTATAKRVQPASTLVPAPPSKKPRTAPASKRPTGPRASDAGLRAHGPRLGSLPLQFKPTGL